MSYKDEFWSAFRNELKKEASYAAAVQRLLSGLTRVRRKALVGAGRLGQELKATRAGMWLAAHPRIAKTLGFAGIALGEGAVGQAAMVPFQHRRRIIEVVPGPEPMQERMFTEPYGRSL